MIVAPSAPSGARSAMFVSLLIGVLVLALKWLAYFLTGSVALYSDALESIVNIAAAGVGLVSVTIAARPPDDDHPFGHTKAEYFSAVVEGALIIVAAVSIIRAAVERFAAPMPILAAGVGSLISGAATGLNGLLGLYLLRRGKALRSPALRADGTHVLTDVVTSGGVLVGLGAAALTGFWLLDPIIAALVALNIVWSGWKLVRDAVGGLMDEAVSAEEAKRIDEAARAAMGPACALAELKTRRAAHTTFVEIRLEVSAETTVAEAHETCDRVEIAVAAAQPGAHVVIHVEPASSLTGA